MNPMQTDCPLRIFMLSVLLGMACLTVPWPDAYPGTVTLIWGDCWEDAALEEPCEVLP